VVTCDATDPDADSLVYDWVTDGRLNIKGAVPRQHYLYNTFFKSHLFYPDAVDTPLDTAWVQCFARDRRGGSDSRIVHLIIRQ
jgi:RimJ/RimL family protein N-acetyltransferase